MFAYSNRHGSQRGIIFYNNSYESTAGTIHMSVGFLSKATGALQQKSLSEGLALPDDNTIVAYRDAVTGLEYLRRATEFRDNGMSLALRGYQHVVLLHWRDLHSTETHPWDRLCDALGGGGVYSVDEALSQLRLRPLVAALKRVINEKWIRTFAMRSKAMMVKQAPEIPKQSVPAVEAEAAAPEQSKPADVEETVSESDERGDGTTGPATSGVAPVEPTAGASEKTSSEPAAKVDGDADDFGAAASFFVRTALELSRVEGGSTLEPDGALVSKLAAASLKLPVLIAGMPKRFQEAARGMLPMAEAGENAERVWAPILGWISLRALPEAVDAVELFDDLRVRNALAETFTSLGLEGDAGWRAAAQVRVLLKAAASEPEELWADADTQWLAGVKQGDGERYVNRECLESLACWLQLPALLQLEGDDEGQAARIAAAAEKLMEAGAKSGYKLEPFLETSATVQEPVPYLGRAPPYELYLSY